MNVYNEFSKIDTLIFDIDGVWTNNQLLITEDGELLRSMNAKDGYASFHALNSGYSIVVITGGRSLGVTDRLKNLGVKELHVGVKDKAELFDDLVAKGKINPETSLFMGDDIPDLKPMKKVALACCPNDAVAEIQAISHYISAYEGGKGCVRDVIERVMRSQGKW